MKEKTGLGLAFVSICLLFLSGCITLNDPESSQEFRSNTIAEITPDQDFGQTFVSRRPKLNRLQLWLQIPEQEATEDFQIIATLYHEPDVLSQPLARVTVSKDDLEKSFPSSILFPAQANRPDVAYFLQVEISGGKAIVYGRNEDQYPLGQAWIGNQPQISDAAFRLGYEYNLVDFLKEFIDQPQILLYLLCIFWLSWIPGSLLLNLSGFNRQYDWGERIALSIGISLAFYPIVFIWTGLVGFTWNQARIWVLMIFLTGWYLILVFRTILRGTPFQRQVPQDWWITASLLAIFLASLSVRLVMVRDLSAPAWVDSVHHALLGNLIVQNGGILETYFPYVSVPTANYHVGFHILLAIFQWLSRLDISNALLLLGQVLNAFMVFSTYLFTTTLVKNRYAGLIAAFVTGLVTPMPAYYTSWGRYTQLAGLVILPAAIAILYPYLKSAAAHSNNFQANLKNRNNLFLIFLGSVLLVGLFVTHYRVFAFQIILLIIISGFAFYSWQRQKFLKPGLLGYLSLALPTALLSLLLISPWLPETIRTLFLPSLAWSQSASPRAFSDFSWNLLTSARGIFSLVIAAAGFIWAVLRKEIFAWILFIWLICLFFLANLNVWKLPGANFVNNTSVVISLFLPISVLCGYLLSWLLTGWYHWLPSSLRKFYTIAIIILSILLGWITAKPLLTIVNPSTLLFREIDRPALNWIKENIPEDETVFINPFAWGYGLYAGYDGGFWISPLSERPTLPPPVLYGLDSNSMRDINIMCNQVIQTNGDPKVLHDLMVQNQLKYVYIGGKGGLLSPTKLQQSQQFIVRFNYQTTWVFEIK
jgi:hypothetical protein